VTLDGEATQLLSVQPGFRFRMFPAEGVTNDPDEGDYFVTRVDNYNYMMDETVYEILQLLGRKEKKLVS